jgi:antitoxin component YwqK of YwqJK toxin-antitoxin module
MIPKNGNFEFKMKWQHDPEIFSNLKILEIERSAEDIEFELYDTLGFMFSIPEVLPVTDGPISLNYDNEYIWAEGSIEASKPYGLWRMYYPSGNLMAILRFENGLLKGNCSFFFDNPDKTEKAIVEYDNNTIKGTYTELYKNGKKKCEIETKNGVPHGDAKFYFENGVEKIKGEFSDSLMNGKWIFYNELGKEILKKKYKEGVEK